MRDREAGEASAGKASDMSKREQLLGCSSGERENSLVGEMRRGRERDGESERGKKSYEPRGRGRVRLYTIGEGSLVAPLLLLLILSLPLRLCVVSLEATSRE